MKPKIRMILEIIIVILILLLVGVGYILYQEDHKNNNLPSVNRFIKEKEKQNYPEEKEEEEEVYVNPLPDARTQYGNQEILGKLEIPNMNIDSYVARAGDNSYYLENSLSHQRDGLGAPFFDYRNTDLEKNRQINIYGHNTKNTQFYDQLPFVNLAAYTDENIFKHYKKIYLSIDQKKLEYEVIAIKIITEMDNEHMKLVFYSDKDYLDHVKKLLQNTLYKDSVNITEKDRLLVLQVCHYNPEDTYLLVIAKEKQKA